MGRQALVEAIEKHGGYVTAGMVAHHLGFCGEGTVEFLAEHEIEPALYRHGELCEMLRHNYDSMHVRGLFDVLRKCTVAISAKPRGFSSTYRRWKDVLSRDTLTNSEVTYLGHRLGEVLGGGHKRSKLTEDEAVDLLIHVMWRTRKHGGYMLTPEQIEKGKNWLKRRDVLKEIARDDTSHTVRIAETTTDFRFVGYAQIETGGYYRHIEYKPMYEAISEHGSFVYRASPWVDGSGTRLEIF